jgi:hypothetical protein
MASALAITASGISIATNFFKRKVKNENIETLDVDISEEREMIIFTDDESRLSPFVDDQDKNICIDTDHATIRARNSLTASTHSLVSALDMSSQDTGNLREEDISLKDDSSNRMKEKLVIKSSVTNAQIEMRNVPFEAGDKSDLLVPKVIYFKSKVQEDPNVIPPKSFDGKESQMLISAKSVKFSHFIHFDKFFQSPDIHHLDGVEVIELSLQVIHPNLRRVFTKIIP